MLRSIKSFVASAVKFVYVTMACLTVMPYFAAILAMNLSATPVMA